jgi:hypothetical protein
MTKLRALVAMVAVGFVGMLHAATPINLSGTVKDQDGKPLAGVEVYLSGANPMDTTGADGKYALTGTTGVRQTDRKIQSVRPVIRGNNILFTAGNARSIIKLEILDLSGRCIRSDRKSPASDQQYSLPLPIGGLSPSTYIVSLNTGSHHFVQRIFVQENGILQTGNNSAGTGPGLRKIASGSVKEVDTLHFLKPKFTPVDTSITAYSGTCNITMTVEDTIPPVVTIINDSTSFAFQDTAHWRVYWNTDSIENQRKFEDNSGLVLPATSTTPVPEGPGFVGIIYEAHDRMYNNTVARRVLILYDSTVHNDVTPPVLTVTPDTMRFTKGEVFNQWQGVTAKDKVDSMVVLIPEWVRVTDNIKSEQPRNLPEITMDVAGTYTITYSTMDTHKNKVSKSRTLIVTGSAGN